MNPLCHALRIDSIADGLDDCGLWGICSRDVDTGMALRIRLSPCRAIGTLPTVMLEALTDARGSELQAPYCHRSRSWRRASWPIPVHSR